MTQSTTPQKCDQCLTEGITLMPMRVTDEFTFFNARDYFKGRTYRLMRQGYIYILDNKNRWYGYVITEGQYFKQFNVSQSAPSLPAQDLACFHKDANCMIWGSMIRIPNPFKDINTLWVAYSPVPWTKKVLDRHKNNIGGTKTKNMVEVDVVVKRFLSGSRPPPAKPTPTIDNNFIIWDKRYSSYLPEEYRNGQNPFTKQPYSPDRSLLLSNIIQVFNQLSSEKKTVALVRLDDIVGKMVDLNELMIQKQLASRPNDNEVHRHTVGIMIRAVKNNIDEKAKADAQRHIDTINAKSELLHPMPRWEGDGPSEAEQQAEAQRRREGAAKYLQNHRQHAWSGYAKLIREDEMNSWLSTYESISMQRQNELNNILEKLAANYKEYYESEELKSVMTDFFDKDNENSCIDYTLIVQQFLGSTAVIPTLTDLYNFYLTQKKASDEDNYIARALTFNQDEVVNKIDELPPLTEGLTPDELATNSWSGLLYTGSAAIFGKYDAIASRVGATVSLAEQLAVPFMKDYRKGTILSRLMISQKEYLFGYHHEKALMIVKGQGNYREARQALMNGIMHIAGSGKLPTRIRESVEQALKTSGDAVRLNNKLSQSFIYYIDKNQVKAAMERYQSSNRAYADKAKLKLTLDDAIYTTPKLYAEGYKEYQSFKNITNQKIDQATRLHYFGAMLQTVSCVFLLKAFFQADTQQQRAVEGTKAVAGLMMLLAGSLEMRGNANKLLASELELMKNSGRVVDAKALSEATRQAGRLSAGARFLSIGGAAIFAGFDVKAGMKSGDNDNHILEYAYYGSAATGLASTAILAFTSLTGLGIAVLIAFIGINLFIGYWKKSGMENWLLHGIWGKDSNGWSLQFELEQFDRAVAGEDIDLKDN